MGAPDPKVVRRSDELRCTVVTNDKRDYRDEFRRYVEFGGKRICTDLFGLLIIPNNASDWEHVFPINQLEKRLRLHGEPVTWREVYVRNLYVKVEARGKVIVEELPRCPICSLG